jgi:diguanylate cyclase (GGDEF)-like protein
MSLRSPVRLYCAAVFATGVALAMLAAPAARFDWIVHSPLHFGVLFAGVLLGEMLPIKVPRRGNDEELTLSAAFTMALLLIGGLGPALVAQGVASVAQDVASGKPAWRVRFNVGQYMIAMLAAWLVVRAISVSPRLDLEHPFASGQLPAMLLGSAAFFLLNTGVVGVAVALYQGVPIRPYFAQNLSFVVITGGVVLLVAPIVLAAASYSVAIVPLCLAPVVAMYRSISQSAASEHLARHDSLTGLPNRLTFHDAVAAAIQDHRIPACVLLMDLDRFKEVNDTLGHRYGDLLLVQVAERFRMAVGADAQIARLGGDEFALVARGCDHAAASAIARRIAECLRLPFELEELVVDAQASIGIALFPAHGSSIESLLQKADVAMYRAKETRVDLELYDERHDHYSPARLALTAELRAAIAGDEITVFYQPQLDFRTGEVPAVEALVRWEHPRLGLLMPGQFVRIAEQSNLIKPLTQRVIQIGLTQAARWRALGLHTAVAVNISPQVLVDRTFTQQVLAALRDAGVPPACLKLEVTESALMSDPETARAVLHELDGLGVEISIDDFGTGYSSLAYLADLPVSEVKIDQSFVSRMADHKSEKIIVNSTIDLAHHLGLRAVAEGVERFGLLAELRDLGCDAAQGHAISIPLPAEDATAWLRRSRELATPVPRPPVAVAVAVAVTEPPILPITLGVPAPADEPSLELQRVAWS